MINSSGGKSNKLFNNYNSFDERSNRTNANEFNRSDSSVSSCRADFKRLLAANAKAKEAAAASANADKRLLDKAAAKIPCLGIIMALCASLFLGTAGMLVKMTTSVHGVQVAVFRAMIQMLIYGAIIVFRRLPFCPRLTELKPVLSRALLGATSITFSYFALKLIPLGDATTIRFSMPIWTLIISYLVLNESCNILKICTVFVCITGVMFIAKPDFCTHLADLVWRALLHCLHLNSIEEASCAQNDTSVALVDTSGNCLPYPDGLGPEEQLMGEAYYQQQQQLNGTAPATYDLSRQLEGSMLALGSSICLALSLVALRLCKHTQAEITILWLSVASVVLGSCLLLAIGQWTLPDNWLDLLFILLNGLCGSAGQWFITNALKIEQSGIISLTRTADIQVAFLYSAFLLHEQIKLTSIIGSLLVSCGVISVTLPRIFSSAEAAVATTTTTEAQSSQEPSGAPEASTAQPPVLGSVNGKSSRQS